MGYKLTLDKQMEPIRKHEQSHIRNRLPRGKKIITKMTELTPRVQNLLKKLLAEFETEDLPVEITLQTSGIQVATAKRSYQMRSH
jgi:hypothetical protein